MNDLFDEFVGYKMRQLLREEGVLSGVHLNEHWFHEWDNYVHDKIFVVDDE